MLIDDEHLAIAHDVVLVELEELFGLDRVVEESDQRRVLGLVQVVDAQVVLNTLNAGRQDADRALLLIDLVVLARAQALRHLGELLVPLVDVPGGGPGDDQRSACLVDENGVDLVDDDEGVAPLDQILGALSHIVAQVVKTELIVRAVGDVAGVLLTTLCGSLTGQNATGGQPQEAVDAPHEVGLVLGEVVVDGYHVDALARQRPQEGGHGRHERLALTGLHLGDIAQVECGTAHDLDVEGPHAQHPVGRLAHCGECLRQQPIEGFPIDVALLEVRGDLFEVLVGEVRIGLRERLDLSGDGVKLLEGAALTDAKDPVDNRHAGFSLVGGGGAQPTAASSASSASPSPGPAGRRHGPS